MVQNFFHPTLYQNGLRPGCSGFLYGRLGPPNPKPQSGLGPLKVQGLGISRVRRDSGSKGWGVPKLECLGPLG